MNYKDIDLEVAILSCGKYYRSLVLHTDHGKWADRPKWQCKSNKNYCDINTQLESKACLSRCRLKPLLD